MIERDGTRNVLSDLNPEQRIMVALLEATGSSADVAVEVVRSDRLTAALFGGEVKPVLQDLARQLADLLDSIDSRRGI